MKNLIIILTFILSANTVMAEQYPLRIYPDQNISTCYNEIEAGDRIMFHTDRKKTYHYKNLKVEPNSPVIGVVDYVQDNGWIADNAQIQFKKFIISQKDSKDLIVNSNLTIDGFEELKYRRPKLKRFFEYSGVIVRGKEVDIRKDKDKSSYNIWINL